MATIECDNCSYKCEPEDHKDPNDLRCPECGDNLTVFGVDALLIIERLNSEAQRWHERYLTESAEGGKLRAFLKVIAMSGDVPADLRKHANIILERVSGSPKSTG